MKESIIHHIVTAAEEQAQNIVLTGFNETITKDNILAILNQSVQEDNIIFSPLDLANISTTFVLGTLTITLTQSAPAITAGNQLFIKVYTDTETSSGDYNEMIAQFFGLPEALPGSYTALTQAEVIASTRAEQVNAWGEDGCPIPDYLPTGVTEAMVEAAATALGITYYEPNFNIATL